MIDLHAHTTISDGTYTPTELIHLAKEIGLKAVAITDHDSIEGHDEAQQVADQLGIQLIKGIEFDVKYKKQRLHILGLNIDSKKAEFLEIYNNYRKGKEKAIDFVLEQLILLGVTIHREELKPYQVGNYMDRQGIAKYLVAKGYTSRMKYSWINYLDKIPMTPYDLIDPKLAFDAIHKAGGKSFLAHFHLPIGLKNLTKQEAKNTLQELKTLGLDGLEGYYPSFTREDQKQGEAYIKEHEFLVCGGSDFHGANRPHIQLGIGEGTFCVPDWIIDTIV